MRTVVCALLIASSFVATSVAARGTEPANANANPKAKAILSFFQGLKARPDKRLVSGQFTGAGTRASLRLLSEIHEKTGRWPALMGVDYADFRHGTLACEVPNRAAIDYWRQGGLVTVSAHLYDPANPNGDGLRDRGVDLSQVLRSGTPTHARWIGELDRLAAGLSELRDAGVVVLWRPFHEMNGGWFWWGAKEPATFIRLWRQMFNYFTRTKRLDNLLWVYAPNHGGRTAAYYPGNHYVDLVGLDAYTDFVDTNHIQGFAEVARLGKPFGFTEFGPHGSHNPPGDYDYRRFIDGVRKDFPPTVFFMCWDAKWSLGSNEHTRDLLDDPWILNRDDLPKGLTGR